MTPRVVAKVGGSLFNLPDLRDRLQQFIASLGDKQIVFVPGGGNGADVIRRLDRLHGIGEEQSHWLALRVLSVNAHFLAQLLGVPVVPSPIVSTPVSVLDAHAFCHQDAHGTLAHTWDFTSDSIAARVAVVTAAELVLLKSTDLPVNTTWQAVGWAGLVDPAFAEIVERESLAVGWLNLRR